MCSGLGIDSQFQYLIKSIVNKNTRGSLSHRHFIKTPLKGALLVTSHNETSATALLMYETIHRYSFSDYFYMSCSQRSA